MTKKYDSYEHMIAENNRMAEIACRSLSKEKRPYMDAEKIKKSVKRVNEELRLLVNDRLAEYVEENCNWCYASIRENGRLHLDDRFEIEHIREIMKIAENWYE